MLRNLHRRIGISAVAFLLLFITTGLLLQHSSWFNLSDKHIAAPIAEALYKVRINTIKNYKVGDHWISQAGALLYLDAVPVADVELNSLHGAIEDNSYLWIVGDNKLLLLSKQGEVMDKLSALEGLPGLVTRIGKDTKGGVVIGGLHNNWQAGEDLLEWRLHDQTRVNWSGEGETPQVPARLQAAVFSHARNHLITWERLLTDLHSGRLFGKVGVVIADLAALLLVFLSATGVVLWLGRR